MQQAEKPHYRDVDVPRIIFLGVVSLILLLVLVVATQAYFYNMVRAEVERKDISQPYWELEDMWLAQRAELGVYRWVDRDQLTVTIPIEQAKLRYVERLATQPADAAQ